MSESNRPPHWWVAEQMGFSIAGVSLLRSGRRQPSIETMEIIEHEFGWKVADQVAARHDYAPALEQVLRERYKEVEEELDRE